MTLFLTINRILQWQKEIKKKMKGKILKKAKGIRRKQKVLMGEDKLMLSQMERKIHQEPYKLMIVQRTARSKLSELTKVNYQQNLVKVRKNRRMMQENQNWKKEKAEKQLKELIRKVEMKVTQGNLLMQKLKRRVKKVIQLLEKLMK